MTTTAAVATTTTTADRARAAALHALPILVLWVPMLVWFLAFKPGIMTNDSLDVWGQVVSGVWVDWHPPVYTALQWVSYQLVGTPALATLVQTLALAWAMSRLLRVAVEVGLPAVPVWAFGALVALTPPVGAFSVHLWKDVPYTVAFLLVVEFFLRAGLERVRLVPPLRVPAHVLVGAALLVMLLVRPNGILVALGTGVVAVVLCRHRLLVVGAWVSALVLSVLVESLLYPLLDVRDPPPRVQAGLAPLDLGYLAVEHPDELDPEELELIDSLSSLRVWREEYDCHWTGTPMDVMAPTDRVVLVREELQEAWREALTASTFELTTAHLCGASVAWNPVPSASERVRFETLFTGILPNPQGLETTPVIDRLNEVGLDVLEATRTVGWQPWFWRAPTWIYLFAALVVVGCIRARSAWMALVLGPFVAQQLSVVAMSGPHARYMLPAGIAAVLALPTLGRTVFVVRPGSTATADGSGEPADPAATTETATQTATATDAAADTAADTAAGTP